MFRLRIVLQGSGPDGPTMAAAEDGKANYRLELATGLGPDGAMVDGQVMVNIIGAQDQTGE